MLYGYSGKLLNVDLSSGKMIIEDLDPEVAADFIGGYGIGARLLFNRIPAMADPLRPENILAFMTGPLTGSGIATGTRWTVCCKSPLTGTWGDANGSGFFGPELKAAGFDGILFSGISQQPVYLLIADGQVSLLPAGHLWGLDTYATDDALKAAHGKDVHSACIGQSGEKLSLISGIVHHKGRIAARSGVGAVMGSKRLKAVVVKGSQKPVFAHPEQLKSLIRKYTSQITSEDVGSSAFYRLTGTPGYIVAGVREGDSPMQNWKEVPETFPNVKNIGAKAIFDRGRKKRSCFRCPIGCWGEIPFNEGTVHQPEYETSSAFGSMLLNDDLDCLLTCTDICNRYGLDTISAGSTVAFAIECFEAGLINEQDTYGLSLRWGDPAGIVTLLKQIARREGFGEVLSDGTRRAAELIGGGAERFAMQVGGQELPMHDPRYEPGLGLVYVADATPGRHTQSAQYLYAVGYPLEGYPGFGKRPELQEGRGRFNKTMSSLNHVINVSGLCLFGYLSTTVSLLPESLSAITGLDYDLEQVLKCGERIANIRQLFNVSEGVCFLEFSVPWRAFGSPPLPSGPTAGLTVNLQSLIREHLEEMDWDVETAIPSERKLESLGLVDLKRSAGNG